MRLSVSGSTWSPGSYFSPCVFLEFWFHYWVIMHGSIWPVTSPPGNPRDQSSPGVENCLKRSCPYGKGVGQIKNMFSLILWSTMYVLFRTRFAQWLQTSRLRMLITYQYLSLYFKVCFKISNECAQLWCICEWIIFLQKNEGNIFFSLAFINRQLKY